MKKTACLLSFLLSSSFALNINEIVDNALENNYDLKSIEQSILIANKNIELSTKWKNPTLTIGANDIHFDDPFKRDSEPMQASYIGFSQVIPMGDKLEIKESIAKKDKKMTILLLEDKKLKLKSLVYKISYDILILEEKLVLLNSYESNIKKIEKLSKALYAYGKSNQNEILNSQISFFNIKIQKENLKNMIDNLYLKLEQITYSNIESLHSNLNIEKLVLDMDIDLHPKILQEEMRVKKFYDIAKLEKQNERADVKLNVSYFNRDDKYKDYANISVNIPLSIYKIEKVKAIKAKLEAKRVDRKIVDIKQSFKTDFKILQNSANSAYINYQTIQKSILPLKKKIQKNLENYNSFAQIKPQKTIKNLNELISYEIKAIDWKKKYFSNIAKSKYYMAKAK